MQSLPRTARLDAPILTPKARPMRWIDAAFATFRQRTELSRLEPRMLRDIGITETEARDEAQRPIWDVPGWWR